MYKTIISSAYWLWSWLLHVIKSHSSSFQHPRQQKQPHLFCWTNSNIYRTTADKTSKSRPECLIDRWRNATTISNKHEDKNTQFNTQSRGDSTGDRNHQISHQTSPDDYWHIYIIKHIVNVQLNIQMRPNLIRTVQNRTLDAGWNQAPSSCFMLSTCSSQKFLQTKSKNVPENMKCSAGEFPLSWLLSIWL